jgi:2-polyprenyl-3-methyl-5-hydroxy-6-metoxy-1,4-benzoquinol methylase
MNCCHPGPYDSVFNDKHAAKDLKRYRKKGPNKTTRMLLDALRAEDVRGASLLDVGAGVGVIHHELLSAGAQTAVHVEAATGPMQLAKAETARRGNADRVRFLQGDFVALAPDVAPADVVTLDRVICCYPDMKALVSASATKARRLYGAVFPRERWMTKAGVAVVNIVLRLFRNPFRSYVHPTAAIDAELRRHGLEPRSVRDTFVWRVAVYSRSPSRLPNALT